MSHLSAFQEAALKEYDALRSEIIARVVMRDQMINYSATMFAAVIGVGAHVGFGTNKLATALILLAYPPVALVFAHGWAIHDHRIWQIGQFILERLHAKLEGLEWEDWLQEQRAGAVSRPRLPDVVLRLFPKLKGQAGWDRAQNWFGIGTFVGTSAATVVLALVVTFFVKGDPEKSEPLSGGLCAFLCFLALVDVVVGVAIFQQIWHRGGSKRERDKAEQTAPAGSAPSQAS